MVLIKISGHDGTRTGDVPHDIGFEVDALAYKSPVILLSTTTVLHNSYGNNSLQEVIRVFDVSHNILNDRIT